MRNLPFLTQPRIARLLVLSTMLAGIAAGIGIYTFSYAKGAAYLFNDPGACANCHVMNDAHDSWLKSSHRAVAVCNDCHTPSGFAGKYWTKASNGFWHSFAFTTQRFHEPIQIKPGNLRVAEAACRDCHEDFLRTPGGRNHSPGGANCTHCHSAVGHGAHR